MDYTCFTNEIKIHGTTTTTLVSLELAIPLGVFISCILGSRAKTLVSLEPITLLSATRETVQTCIGIYILNET